MSSNYRLIVDGTTYYFSDVNQYNGVAAAKTDESRMQLIQAYQNDSSGNTTISTNENDLAVVDIGTGSAQTVGQGANENQKASGDWWLQQYMDATGLTNAINKEQATLEDLESVFNEIEAQTNTLLNESVNYNDPASIKEKMAKISGLYATANTLVGALGGEVKTGGNGGYVTGGAIAAGTATVVGLAAFKAGTGVVAACAAAGPPGWIALGVAAIAVAGCCIWNYFSNKDAEEKLAELLEKAENKRSEIEHAANNICDNFKANSENIINSEISRLDDLVDGNFQGLTTENISKTLSSIKGIYEKVSPYLDAAGAIGIQLDINPLVQEKFGSEDGCKKYMQDYIDAYTNQVELDLENGVVPATTDSMSLYDDINALIDEISGDNYGLNPSKLNSLLRKISTDNQKVVDDDAGNLNPGSGVTIGDYAGNYGTAGENKDGVEGAASGGKYDLDTGKYDEAKDANQKGARELMKEYLDSITTEGKSIEQLEALYKEVGKEKTEYQKYADELGISLKGFDDAMDRIKEAEQAVVDSYLDSVNPYSKKTESELDVLIGQLSAKRDSYSSIEGLDLSGFDTILEDIEDARAEIRRLNQVSGNQGNNNTEDFEGFDTTNNKVPVREQIKNYLNSISIEGKSKAELQQLYREVFQARGEAMKYEGFDDFSGFDIALDRIEEAINNYNTNNNNSYTPYIPEGKSAREEMIEYLDSIPSTVGLSRRQLRSLYNEVLNKRNEYSKYEGFDDFSGFDIALDRISRAIDETYNTNTSSDTEYQPNETSKREEMKEYLNSVSLYGLSRNGLVNLRNEVISKMNEYSKYAGFDDFSGFDRLLERIDEAIYEIDTASSKTAYVDSYSEASFVAYSAPAEATAPAEIPAGTTAETAIAKTNIPAETNVPAETTNIPDVTAQTLPPEGETEYSEDNIEIVVEET